MVLNTLKCKHLTPLGLQGLIEPCWLSVIMSPYNVGVHVLLSVETTVLHSATQSLTETAGVTCLRQTAASTTAELKRIAIFLTLIFHLSHTT